MEFILFYLRKMLAQFLSSFLPTRALRRRFRSKFSGDKIIFVNQVDNFVPKPVLKAMSEFSNEYFIKENQKLANLALSTQASQGGGGDLENSNHPLKAQECIHKGYFDFDKSAKSSKSARNPWAYIRVKNEAITLKSCLESILPAIQRGVIGYNDCDDGSEQIILDFCQKYPSFIPVKYPYEVQIQNPQSEENKFHQYSNFVLDFIPKNEWFIKIDVDHVYDAAKLFKSFYLAQHFFDAVFVARMNFIIKNKQIYIGKLSKSPINLDEFYTLGVDHWLVCNQNLHFKEWFPNESKLSYEVLRLKNRRFFHTELNNWHFPLVKKSRSNSSDEAIKNAFTLEQIKHSLLIGTRIDIKMLDENKILEIYNNFNWQGTQKP